MKTYGAQLNCCMVPMCIELYTGGYMMFGWEVDETDETNSTPVLNE